MKISNLVAAAVLCAAPAFAQSCLFSGTTPIGTNLNLTDDSTKIIILPFAFPFAGTNYNIITVSSNGFIWFGVNTDSDLSDSEAELLAQGPRIAAYWDDLNPASTALPAGGGVFYNQTATQASIVWKSVPRYGSTSIFISMEVVLSITGEIDLYYDPSCGMSTDASIIGISAGNGAAANALDLSVFPTTPTPILAGATGYELFPLNTMDLAGTTINFLPAGAGYVVANSALGACAPNTPPTLPNLTTATAASYGAGCPATGNTGNWYEPFAGSAIDLSNTSWHFTSAGPGSNIYAVSAGTGIDTTYTPADAVVQVDDGLVNCSLAGMGSFPFNGANLTSVDVCSNGFLWMSSGNTDYSYAATAASFATSGARLAPCWMDVYVPGGGTFYWTQTPAFCMATWENVAVYNVAGSSNTFQCKLWVNGDVDFNYGTVLNNGTLSSAALVGFAKGLSAGAAAPVDITNLAVPLVDLNGAVPLAHTSSLPSLGGNYDMTTSLAPAGALIGVTLVGFVQTAVDLTPLGAPGCTRLVDPLAVGTHVLLGGATSWTDSMPIPFNAAFVGFQIRSQGAAYAPGLNPLGIAASNGRVGTMGL
jgi:hypothetical protein